MIIIKKKLKKFFKKFLYLINKFLKIKFTSRNMFGSIGHTVAELDYYFKLVHKYKINKFKIIFLSNQNKMAEEAYNLFSRFFYYKIISNKYDYLIKKYILSESNNLGIDFGLSTIKYGKIGGNYSLDFVFKKYINYFKLNAKIKKFNPFKEIPFCQKLENFLNDTIGKSEYILVQIKEQKGNSTILKTDPKTYIKSIKYFKEKNYKIIFAGKKENMPKEFKELGVINYSNFKYHTLQSDLNLVSRSKLLISSASGFACLAQVNDTPCVYSNSWHIVLTPSSKYCVHIPYLFFNKNNGGTVKYDEIINLYINQYNQTFYGEDKYEVVANKSDEILEGAKEAMSLKDNYEEPSKIYQNFKDKYKNLPIKYCESRISTFFIKKYPKLF